MLSKLKNPEMSLVLGCLLVSGLFFVEVCHSQTRSSFDKRYPRPTIGQAFLVKMIEEKLLTSDYFVRELAITNAQREKLIHIVDEHRKSFIQCNYKYCKIQFEEDNDVFDHETAEAEREKLGRERLARPFKLLRLVENELVPNQMARIQEIVLQRYTQKSYHYLSFQFPYVVSVSVDSEVFSSLREWNISEKEKDDLKNLAVEQKEYYLEEREKLLTKARQQLKDRLPEKLIKAMENSLGPIYDRTQGQSDEEKLRRKEEDAKAKK